MWKIRTILSVILLYQSVDCTSPEIEDEELKANHFMQIVNQVKGEEDNKLANAGWNYESNITDHNLQIRLQQEIVDANVTKSLWEEAVKFNWKTFSDESLKRKFKLFTILGFAALPEEKLTRYNKIVSEMQKVYSTAKICAYDDANKCNLSLEPHLVDILQNSRNADELKHVWVEWRKAVGPHVRHLFKEYVDISNEAARLNNFTDNTEYWLDEFEDPNFRQQLESIWEQLKPLYLQIHAYVRYQLRQKYGDVVSERGPIPAHLLGNMWAQTWEAVEDYSLPYPDKKAEDLTKELEKQQYTVTKIFKTAEDFFKSINLTEMPEEFWQKSILEKPKDRDLVCHASAWDFSNGKDFRIKQCTEVTLQHFITAHHEMGHIEYYLQYKDKHLTFRHGANSGFHEAVGDLIALSVQSRKHLRKLDLIKTQEDDPESLLNNLFGVGIRKIVFLPFGYLMDLWRWDIFSGKTTPDQYNCKWWELRENLQGIEPPVDRSEQDFDPAAKYHIVADVPYIRYFISFVIQFQFHRSLCEIAGQYDPNDPSKALHECDIYDNKEAGEVLKKMLAMGSSKPWPDALQVLTGQRTMDASGLLEYFKPLQKWLEQENRKNDAFIGWEKSNRVCSSSRKKEKNDDVIKREKDE